MDDVTQEHLTKMKYLEACIKVCLFLLSWTEILSIKGTISDPITGSGSCQNYNNRKMQCFSFVLGITTPLPFSAHYCKKSGESKLLNSYSSICLLDGQKYANGPFLTNHLPFLVLEFSGGRIYNKQRTNIWCIYSLPPSKSHRLGKSRWFLTRKVHGRNRIRVGRLNVSLRGHWISILEFNLQR